MINLIIFPEENHNMIVRVVKQTPTRLYTTVKCDYDGDIWRVKTNRLTPCG